MVPCRDSAGIVIPMASVGKPELEGIGVKIDEQSLRRYATCLPDGGGSLLGKKAVPTTAREIFQCWVVRNGNLPDRSTRRYCREQHGGLSADAATPTICRAVNTAVLGVGRPGGMRSTSFRWHKERVGEVFGCFFRRLSASRSYHLPASLTAYATA